MYMTRVTDKGEWRVPEHRGAVHRQMHTRFEAGGHVFVLTVQGPEATFEGAREGAIEMATSLRVA